MSRTLCSFRAVIPVLAVAALTLFSGDARAQLPCGPPNPGAIDAIPPVPQAGLTEVWVDPINGNDATGTVNDRSLPFFTITTARNQLLAFMGPPNAANRGLVHLDPGIYSLATNGETFPIVMTDFIDIQGVGAKQVVLRGDGSQAVPVFFPWALDDCTCGQGALAEVLVSFSLTENPEYDEMLDGVTLQGGDVQVYAETELHDLDGRVSNCIFDLLENPFEDYIGPSFGILMVHTWLGEDEQYRDVRLNVFNNTFVQSWDPLPDGGEPAVSAAADSVAICDVNNPLCNSSFPDPDPTLRGVGNPNIQSNVIRAFDPTAPTALMGIDDSDVSCAVGTRVGDTNAFDPAEVAGQNPDVSPNGLFFCSNVVGAFPLPVVVAGAVLNPNGATGGRDPAFVGEALTSTTGGAIPATHARDWRILPDSVLVDQGTSPLLGVLSAVNGTTHFDLGCTPQSSFDFDGEYSGNLRVQVSPLLPVASAAVIDLGYDETSVMIDCAMANDSIVHAPVPVPFFGPFVGLGTRVMIYPSSGPGAVDLHTVNAVNTPLGALGPFPLGFTGYTQFPGTVGGVPGGIFPTPWLPGPPLVAPFMFSWLEPLGGVGGIFVYVPLSPLTNLPFVSAYDGAPHALSFGLAPSSMGTTGFPAYFAEQALYLPAAGPNAGLVLLSNLQCVND